MTLVNDIVWNNSAPYNPDFENDGSPAEGSVYLGGINYTLEGNTSDSHFSGGTVGDIVNVGTSPAIVASPANNGGPTLTMSPVPGAFPTGAGGNVTSTTSPVAATATLVPVANVMDFGESSLPTLASGSYCTVQIDSEQMAVIGVQVGKVASTCQIASAGTGYTVGDVLTAVGGTGIPATFTVASVNGTGGITGFTVDNPGCYSSAPNNNISLTGGSGSGGQVNVNFAEGVSSSSSAGPTGPRPPHMPWMGRFFWYATSAAT